MELGLVVMASGLSQRFGRNKLLQDVSGKPMIRRVFDAIPLKGFRTVVVTRYPEILALALERGYEAVDNQYPDLRDTIRLGVTKLYDLPGICFMVGDQPWITALTLERLRSEFLQNPACIARAAHKGVGGNPVIFPKAVYDELLALTPSQSGAQVISKHQNLVRLVEAERAELWDVDSMDDLRRDGHEN